MTSQLPLLPVLDDAAGDAVTRIAGRLALVVVGHRMHDDGRAIGVEGDSDIAVLVDFGSRQERITQPYTAMFKL